jgi:hypothetical protein
LGRRTVPVLGLCCTAVALLAACTNSPTPSPETKTVTMPPSANPSMPSGTTGGSSSTAPGRVFDAAVMQADVKKILTDTYQLEDVGEVVCPPNQAVMDGVTFTCSVELSGDDKTVTITVTGEDGRYEVGAPE